MYADELADLHADLERVRELIDAAPERYQSTTRAYLAEADHAVLMLAGQIVHRLMLWQKYPQQSPESYLRQKASAAMPHETPQA